MIRLSWVSVVLLIGHLVLVAGLAMSAHAERSTHVPLKPELSIQNGLRN